MMAVDRGQWPPSPEPVRLYWCDPLPELPWYEEDWFRFYYLPPETDSKYDAGNRVTCYEVHEMCSGPSCTFRPAERCSFHPPGCECSEGECQKPPG